MTARHRLYAAPRPCIRGSGRGLDRRRNHAWGEVTATLAPTPQTERRSQHPLLVSIQRPVKCRPRAGR